MVPNTPTTFLISPLPASAVLEAYLWFTLTRPSHCPPSHRTPFPGPVSSVRPKWPASLNSLGTWHFLPAPTDLLISHFDIDVHTNVVTRLSMPPWSRLLVPGVFKPSCFTPFTHFLRLVSVYWPFHLYFIPKTLHNTSVFSSLLTAYF